MRGAAAPKFPVGSYYGYATGVVGLRLFPNPAFDEEAEKKWDAEKFYNDPAYYNNKDLVRPYRVGMSCAFCHVGPNPTNPPADPANPKWENLNSNPGAQYFWWDRVFTYTADPSDFFYQYFHQSRPGALDTSLLSTDYIANPRTMNAVYNFGARLRNALRLGGEKLTGGERNNKQLNEYVPPGTPLTKYYTPPGQVWTPRILKDGSDSAGALGSLNRVYVNIGLFSEEWLEHFNPIVGGRPITAITIATGRKIGQPADEVRADQDADPGLHGVLHGVLERGVVVGRQPQEGIQRPGDPVGRGRDAPRQLDQQGYLPEHEAPGQAVDPRGHLAGDDHGAAAGGARDVLGHGVLLAAIR